MTMTINEAISKYRLPPHSTQEDLECSHDRVVLKYGDLIVMAGYYYTYKGPCYYGAAYEFLDDDHTCEGIIGLRAASEVEFEDEGHAVAWAMKQ